MAANVGDRVGAKHLLANLKARLPPFQLLLADGGYTGDAFAAWLATRLGWLIEISINLGAGFIPIPQRWVVERTFAWLGQCRRLSKDYEDLPSSSEAFIYLAMSRLMVKRLA